MEGRGLLQTRKQSNFYISYTSLLPLLEQLLFAVGMVKMLWPPELCPKTPIAYSLPVQAARQTYPQRIGCSQGITPARQLRPPRRWT